MPRPRICVAVAIGLAAATAVSAQTPAGGEFRVTFADSIQDFAACAADPTGNFVVAWRDGDFSQRPILAQRFDPAGQRLGVAFQASLGTSYGYSVTRMAAAADGSFVVAWRLYDVTAPFARARRFNRNGVAVGRDFRTPSIHANIPAVGSARSGAFVMVWDEANDQPRRDIHGQRVDPYGVPLGAEFVANTSTTDERVAPDVAVDGAGNFVVVWTKGNATTSHIFGRRYTADGTALGDEFAVDSGLSGHLGSPSVAAAPDGRFVAAWASLVGPRYRPYARRFSAAGVPIGLEFTVSATLRNERGGPRMAADAAGNFVVAWSEYRAGPAAAADILARRFAASGQPRGDQFMVNSSPFDDHFIGGVASDPLGNFLIAWGHHNPAFSHVLAHRYGGLVPSALQLGNAGGVFEPGDTVDVRPTWRNVNGQPQTFGGAAASFGGPQPATYQILDAAADYGTLGNGLSAQCTDCYRVSVTATTRPMQHWDAALEEKITPDTQGQDQLWQLHLGHSFADVAPSSPFYRFVETLLHRSVSGGCGGVLYCPGASTARDQLAVFVLAAKEGPAYRPPTCGTPVFADVPASSPFCPYVEELARRGVTGGCGGGNYCPAAAVPREQMPVFVLRTLDPSLDPPPCGTPRFADVPASSPYCRWIEELARRGVVGGCGGAFYCPTGPVTREQMSVFIVATFGLTLYGP